jgi:hypothetical protein
MNSHSANTTGEVMVLTLNPFNIPVPPIRIEMTENIDEIVEIIPSSSIVFFSTETHTMEYKNYETR